MSLTGKPSPKRKGLAMNLRDEFEKEFRVPNGVSWRDDESCYEVLDEVADCDFLEVEKSASRHNSLIAGYQAAHAAQQKRVEELEGSVMKFAESILHGDEDHRKWLIAEAEKFTKALSATAREGVR